MIKFKNINGLSYLAVGIIKRKSTLNGEKSLTGTLYSGDEVLNSIDKGWSLEFEDEPYVVTYYKRNDSDNSVEFDAIHKFFWDMSKSVIYKSTSGSATIKTYLDSIFSDSGYRYSLNFSPNAIQKDNWGMKNRLSLFNDIISSIDAEFEINGTLISIFKNIGTDLSTIVRYGFNLSDMSIENDASRFVTYGEGFGALIDKDKQDGPRLHVTYESPLAKVYGRLQAEPIEDERYTVEDNLLNAVKAKVDNSFSVSVNLSLYDLKAAGYPYKMANVGDWLMAIDESVNFSQRVRIISIDDEFAADGTRISYSVTAGDVGIVQRYQEANATVQSKLNNAIDSANQAVSTANYAQISADGKNTIYRLNSINNLPENANEGDLAFVQSGDGTLMYVYTKKADGSFYWEKRIDPEMGEQIADGVDDAVSKAKAYTDGLDSTTNARIEQTTADINQSIAQTQADIQTAQASANKALDGNKQTAADLNTYKSANDVAMSKQQTLVNQVSDDGKTVKSILSDGQGNWYQDLNTALSKQSVMVNSQGDISRAQQTADNATTIATNTQGYAVTVNQTATQAQTVASNALGQVATLSQKADEINQTVANKADVSYVDQKADSITKTVSTNFDKLVYENRNYVLNGGFENGTNNGYGVVYDSSTATKSGLPQPSGKYASFFQTRNGGDAVQWFTLTTPITIPANQPHTISYDYSVAGDAQKASDYLYYDNGVIRNLMAHDSHDMTSQTTWKRVSYTFIDNKPVTITKIRFGMMQVLKDRDGWKAIDNIKIEYGTKATSWTQAPEDIDSAISQVKQTADGLTSTVKSKADISYVDQKANEINIAVKSKADMASVNVLKDQVNLSVKKGDVVNQINLDASGTLIRADKIILDGNVTVTQDFYAKGANFKNLNASNITSGTINAANVNLINLNANSITAGAINGVNLKINLDTGWMEFARGRIKSLNENLDINIDDSYIAVKDWKGQALLRSGGFYLTQQNIFDANADQAYFSIENNISSVALTNTAKLKGRDMIVITTRDNDKDMFTIPIDQELFAGLSAGRDGNEWLPTKVGGASRGVIISGGKKFGSFMAASPYIVVGDTSTAQSSSFYGTRITLAGEYVQIPSAYYQTNSTPANLAITSTGALVRTTSASKYKTSIHHSDDTHMGNKLLNIQPATWYDKATIRRFKQEGDEQQPRAEFGLIAEDLAREGLDWLVVRDPKGEIEGIKYDRLAVALLPVIKNLKQEIADLKEKLNAK